MPLQSEQGPKSLLDHRPPSRTRQRILATLVLLPLFLVAAELVVQRLRFQGPARTDTIAAGYMPIRLRPDFRGSIGEMGHVVTDRYGFRGEPDFPLHRPAGEFRVLALGDSIGFGLGVSAQETYSQEAERELRSRHESVQVINAAGQGYSPSTYLAYLEAEGFRFEPNLLLVQVEPSNDVSDEALLRLRYSPQGELSVYGGRYCVAWDGNLLGSVTLGPYPPERTYLYTMILRRALFFLDRTFPNHSAVGTPGYFHLGFDRFLLTPTNLDLGWERLQDALMEIDREARERGAGSLILLSPTRYAFSTNEAERRFGNEILQRLGDWAREAGLPFVDPRPDMAAEGGADLFTDFAHLKPRGHAVVARCLAESLRLALRDRDRALLHSGAQGKHGKSKGPATPSRAVR